MYTKIYILYFNELEILPNFFVREKNWNAEGHQRTLPRYGRKKLFLVSLQWDSQDNVYEFIYPMVMICKISRDFVIAREHTHTLTLKLGKESQMYD
jgi:hypothetical protein